MEKQIKADKLVYGQKFFCVLLLSFLDALIGKDLQVLVNTRADRNYGCMDSTMNPMLPIEHRLLRQPTTIFLKLYLDFTTQQRYYIEFGVNLVPDVRKFRKGLQKNRCFSFKSQNNCI